MTRSIETGLNVVLNSLADAPLCRFFILGKTNTPLSPQLKERAEHRGLVFLKWSYGEAGSVFLLTSHTDVAQSAEMVVLKLGFARLPSSESLEARQMLELGLFTPQQVNHTAYYGNTLVAGISQRQPAFYLFQSLTSTTPLYYWKDHTTLLFSDTLRMLVSMVARLELNAESLPHHMLFRTVTGKMTYFKDIYKVPCGHLARFRDGALHLEQLERLDDWLPDRQATEVSASSINAFEAKTERVVNSYIRQIEATNQTLLVLLSGGIDSSLLTSYVRAGLPPTRPLQSASYTIEAEEFETEIGYAKHAIDVFETTHQFVHVLEKDYLSYLEQLIDLLTQPVSNEQDPCYLALAQALSGQATRFLFSGSASDTLLGYDDAKRLLQVERYRKIPFAQPSFSFLAKILENILPHKAYGLREAAFLLQAVKKPLSPHHPDSRESLFTNTERVQAAFDARAISDAIQYRRAEFELFSDSQHIAERAHFMGLIHNVFDEESALTQVFRAYGLEIVTPFLDSEFVKATFAFDPNIRYYAQERQKWLPKTLIEKRLSNRSHITQQPKRGGGFDQKLRQWMKSGILRDLVQAIDRPGYMTVAHFEQAKEDPDWFTWNLLTLDLFTKRIISSRP